eukprot:PLAT3820.4.p1 GENE.PLAT3820.4~~PLAT3820.4.p1  ORF type:complete len:537 (-),score=192.56 PLAT3820.4:491-1885(-)
MADTRRAMQKRMAMNRLAEAVALGGLTGDELDEMKSLVVSVAAEVAGEESGTTGFIQKDHTYYRRKGALWTDLSHTPQDRLQTVVTAEIVAADEAAVDVIERRIRRDFKKKEKEQQARLDRAAAIRSDFKQRLRERKQRDKSAPHIWNPAMPTRKERRRARRLQRRRDAALSRRIKRLAKPKRVALPSDLRFSTADFAGLLTGDDALVEELSVIKDEPLPAVVSRGRRPSRFAPSFGEVRLLSRPVTAPSSRQPQRRQPSTPPSASKKKRTAAGRKKTATKRSGSKRPSPPTTAKGKTVRRRPASAGAARGSSSRSGSSGGGTGRHARAEAKSRLALASGFADGIGIVEEESTFWFEGDDDYDEDGGDDAAVYDGDASESLLFAKTVRKFDRSAPRTETGVTKWARATVEEDIHQLAEGMPAELLPDFAKRKEDGSRVKDDSTRVEESAAVPGKRVTYWDVIGM